MSPHDDDTTNPSRADSFSQVAERRFSRRRVLCGGAVGAAAFLAGGRMFTATPAAASPGAGSGAGVLGRPQGAGHDARLGFEPIGLGFGDEVAVPTGYTARAFVPWGTPILGSYPAFVPGGNTADEQAEQVGMHHDGMHFFPFESGSKGSRQGLLVVNHEYTDEGHLHTGTQQPSTWLTEQKAAWTLEMVRRSQHAHGVSVIKIERDAGGEWQVVRSHWNRRITANTPMTFSGPAAGHRLLKTSADPAGRTPLGTVNNCANGYTPWGTYLTCEENFNGYFRVDGDSFDDEHAELNTRYGVGGDRNNWATKDPRFVVTPTDPNEPNRFGWVVEIDPFDATSTPVKRTALGRTKHEGAAIHVSKGGRVVAYLGDDQAGEYIYKFVGAKNYKSMLARGVSPLDEGTLYVAKFDDDGTGSWIPLVHGTGELTAANGFVDQGDVLVKTRLAASAVGATPMDRPEWTAVDPNTGAVYCTLTNNTSSSKVENGANPRTPNRWGHIVRWTENHGDHSATAFDWDLFVLAGPGRDAASPEGSTVPSAAAFGSPDGLWVDPDGRVWIQTDGAQPGGANDQMLVADPYSVDPRGGPDIKRFFTGVKNGEVTGITATPDQRTMFVNIQHPGEGGGSSWPNADGISLPRSATVVITKDDGGVIGS